MEEHLQGKMLVIVQYPFADLRMFAPAMGGKTLRPNWAKTDPTGFVRGFGQIEDRYKALRTGRERSLYQIDKAERYYVNASRSIYPSRRGLLPVEHGVKYQHLFSRIISDGYFTTRIEIGFEIVIDSKRIFSPNFFDATVESILKLPLQFRTRADPRRKTYNTSSVGTISSAVKKIRDRLFARTTLTNSQKRIHATDYMDFLGLLVFIDLGKNCSTQSLVPASQIQLKCDVGFDLTFFEKSLANSPVYLWISGGCGDGYRDRLRRTRLHILRISPEVRALEAAVIFMSELGLRGEIPDGLREQFLQRVQRSSDRLAETSQSLSSELGALEVGTLASGQAMWEVVQNIKAHFAQVSTLRAHRLDQRMDAITRQLNLPMSQNPHYDLDAKRGINFYIQLGDGIMNTKNYSADTVGVQGDNNYVRDVNVAQTWNEIAGSEPVDFQALKMELAELQAALNAQAQTSAQVDEAASVKKAELAAGLEDKGGILNALKSVGEWTLGVAEKLTVPVALAILKKLMP